MTSIDEVKCVTCRAGELSLTKGEIYISQVRALVWQVKKIPEMNLLGSAFKFKNFVEALQFANKIRSIGEKQDHHRVIVTERGKETMGTSSFSKDEGWFVFYHAMQKDHVDYHVIGLVTTWLPGLK